MRETQRKGDIAVAQAIATFTKINYDVSIPMTESAAYDLIIDTGLELKRVQVKYCGGLEVDLRNIHSNSKGYVVKKLKEDSFDWLYVYTKDGRQYLITESLAGRRSIKLSNQHLLI